MQINNWIDFVLFFFFTLGVVVIGVPSSIYLLKKGIEGLVKYGFSRLPENFLATPGLGNYSLEVLLYGVFVFLFCLWYLFVDREGQLANFIHQAQNFLAK